ncbi:MAG TPA: YaeQ family protein [Burkholderiales bacterium]|nr:YaeQ family protein [Burkholderiales bacterium]
MALKSTIHKAELQIADMDRGYYADHAVTIAKHPSETDERMMVRLLAFAHGASDRLAFGKGISDTDEPDLWERDLTGAIERWVEVGLPDERRLAKAAGRAREVVVYAYGARAVPVWWGEIEAKLARLSNVSVFGVPADASRDLEALARRTMRLQFTIQEGHVLVTSDDGSVSFDLERLREGG